MSGSRWLVVLLGGLVLVVVAIALSTLSGDPVGPGTGTEPGSRPGEDEGRRDPVPDTADTPAIAVTGRVVRRGSESVLAGARVVVEAAEAETDAEGSFALDGVKVGRRELTVEVEGLPPFTTEVTVNAASPDLGTIEVPSATVLSGLVVDADGDPVPGAEVRILERDRYGTGSWWSIPKRDQFQMGIEVLDRGAPAPGTRTATEADGGFRIEGLSPGKYFVTARAKGLASGDVDEVAVPETGEVAVSITLEKAVAITGKVLDTRKNPVEGARILGAPWNQAVKLPFAAMEEVSSGPDGAFTLDHLVEGTEYLILARAPDGRLGIGLQVNAPAEDVEVQVGPRFTLTGSVTDEETGQAVPGVQLFALLGYTESDENGHYRMEGVVKSAFFRYIWTAKEGYEDGQHSIGLASSLIGGPVIEKDITVSREKPATLRVTVRDPSGRPLGGVALLMTTWGEEVVKARGITRPNGEALLEGLPRNARRLKAIKPGYVMVGIHDSPDGRMANAQEYFWVNLEPGQETSQEVTLASVGPATGKVTDHDGKPLEGVELRAMNQTIGTTDAKGRFSTKKLADGFLTVVTFAKEGFVDESVRMTPGSGEEVEVVLSPGAAVAGVVVDEAGKPVKGVLIYLQDGASVNENVVSGSNGGFKFEGLPSSTCTLLAYREGYAPLKTSPFRLDPGVRREDFEIRLPAGVEATFMPSAPGGGYVACSILAYGPLDKPEEERVVSRRSADGEDPAVLRLLPGRYRVVVSPQKSLEGVGAVEVEKNITASGEVRVELSANLKRIEVRVVVGPGGRAAGLQLTRTEPAKPSVQLWFQPDEDGRLRTPGLPPGKYSITVYAQKGGGSIWENKSVDDIEPGGKTIELDFTK